MIAIADAKDSYTEGIFFWSFWGNNSYKYINRKVKVDTGDRIVHIWEHNLYDISSGIAWNPVVQYND